MINVLVPTKPDDTHAINVKLALEKIGHKAHLWYTADFPCQQSHSLEIINNEISWKMKGKGCVRNSNDEYNIVWFRRPSKPILPNILHSEDIENAKNENGMLYQTLWQVILPRSIWINSTHAALRASSKLLQLKIATKIGLKIPRTLISNNAIDIKNYIKQNKGAVIYKSLYPMTWINEHEIRLTYTSPIAIEDLPSDEILQATPGIFQQQIQKSYELRVTYFGNKYIAVKIDSQKHKQARMDWRSAPTKELTLEKTAIPHKLNLFCQSFMKEMGIVFGCFDFIVTPDNEYYFLEVNEQGQFLWIEEVNPDIKMLEAFVEYLVSFSRNSKKYGFNLSLKDFESEVLYCKAACERNHLNPDRIIHA